MSTIEQETIWAGSDLTYACLIDNQRTQKFNQAIESSVNKGDVVVDIGSGTGILSFFAARAGARKIYAIEIDPVNCRYLKNSIKANNLGHLIEVIEGDVVDVTFPEVPDVIIAELIETGLMDEMQASVINKLHDRKLIGPKTILIPKKYETYIELVEIENNFYGFKIMSPIHNWPNYISEKDGWLPLKAKSLTPPILVKQIDFSRGQVDLSVNETVKFNSIKPGKINAIKISGNISLTDNITLGATNSLNGDKYIPIEELENEGRLRLNISYKMAGGLSSFSVRHMEWTE